jgi:hypothetical protein
VHRAARASATSPTSTCTNQRRAAQRQPLRDLAVRQECTRTRDQSDQRCGRGATPGRDARGEPCSICGRLAAAIVPGGLRPGEALICPRCVEAAGEHIDPATISAEDLTELDTLSEQS